MHGPEHERTRSCLAAAWCSNDAQPIFWQIVSGASHLQLTVELLLSIASEAVGLLSSSSTR